MTRNYSDMTRVERLEAILETIKECKSEFPGMDWDGIEERASKVLRKEKEAADYHVIYKINNGQAQEILFEGPRYLCDQYMENHSHLKGQVIQVKAY